MATIVIPKYGQIAQAMREGILSGAYQRGEALPAEAELCRLYGAAVHAVRRALAVLRDEGWIMTTHGVGSVVVRGAERESVTVMPGDRVDSRMLSAARRAELGVPPGVPVTVVTRADGTEEFYDSTRYAVIAQAPPSRGKGAPCA